MYVYGVCVLYPITSTILLYVIYILYVAVTSMELKSWWCKFLDPVCIDPNRMVIKYRDLVVQDRAITHSDNKFILHLPPTAFFDIPMWFPGLYHKGDLIGQGPQVIYLHNAI